MKTILLTNNYTEGPRDIVNHELPKGFKLKMLESNTQDAIENAVDRVDYILASGRVKINKDVLDKANNLKMIQRTGVGVDSLDLDELKKRNIPLYVNQGVNAESVAEHALLLILACLKKLPVIYRNTANGIWKKQEQGVQTYELAGKKVGLIGMGNIARTLVKLLKGFGVTILYYDLYRLSEEREKELGIIYCNLEEVLAEADILSLHCPLTDETKSIINSQSISKMKDGAVFVNTARGGLVETDALVEALNTKKIAFAGLDVYEEEPLRATNPVIKPENVILTPHIGGITYDSFQRMMHDAMRNILLFDQGEFEKIHMYLYQ